MAQILHNRSLPNWTELQAHKPTHRHRRLRREETAEDESPEDVRQRNVKEAEILASNIGEGGIQLSELLSDVNQLKKLALLHESMVCKRFGMEIMGIHLVFLGMAGCPSLACCRGFKGLPGLR